MANNKFKIYDIILKIIITAYLSDFLAYIGIEKTIVEVLKTEITTLNGRTVYLDFLCKTEDNKLYNIEFQLKGPTDDDLKRFFNYNIIAHIRHSKTTETIVINFRTKKSGVKEIKIEDSINFHPKFVNLGDIDYKKILNNIEHKIKDNINLSSSDEISLMIMALLPKYQNKTEMLKRIFNVLTNKSCFDETKYNIIEGVIQLEIEKFLPNEEIKELEKEIEMTPETQAIFKQALEETNNKWNQIEIEKTKKEIAKSLKGTLTDNEISKHTGLSIETIKKL